MNSRHGSLRWLVGLLSLLAIAAGSWQLEAASSGLVVTRQWLGTMPVTVFRPAAAAGQPAKAAPVLLVAHGFAGSQQLMQPFATTLARSGWLVITFDFPGHGRNSAPMRGGLQDTRLSQQTLLAAMDQVAVLARTWAQAGQSGNSAAPVAGYAVLGHSMASDIVVRHAQAHPEVFATVGLSLFAPSIQVGTAANSPRNLLVISGALEPAMMATEALRVVGLSASAGVGQGAAALGQTVGNFAQGTARRAVLAPGVEHISVLYSATSLAETRAWLAAAAGQPLLAGGFIDARGPALGWLLLGVVGLAWPLSGGLPLLISPALLAAQQPRARGHTRTRSHTRSPTRTRWWRWPAPALVAVLPALLTPLLLWPLPTKLLPLLLGDYLLLHFALYGLLSAATSLLLVRRAPRLPPGSGRALLLAIGLATAYALLAVGLPLDRYVFNLQPGLVRLPLIAALCAGTLPYFWADEAWTRDPAAPPAAYLVSKLCFLLSLVAAIALNPGRLFFLAIIVPAILVLFVVYGLFSRWIFRRTGVPLVAAVANALVFACFIGATFPLVA